MWDKFAQRLFIEKLRRAEEHFTRLTEFQQGFVTDMRMKYDSRRDAEELGISREYWEPTAKQLNYLNSIASEL